VYRLVCVHALIGSAVSKKVDAVAGALIVATMQLPVSESLVHIHRICVERSFMCQLVRLPVVQKLCPRSMESNVTIYHWS
jgi:hypothetical protein